ncbi:MULTISPECIES: AAA family ATPase [Colwellia]|uniref:ATPase AAA n=1 Tax=Colwellia marinimaniae TaxID=1513592 RepID=A0ABQ0MZ13_9GAMM|nr:MULTISPECIES: AAA family ATPase [Colwellia]GAW96881.1 ATPase AAA [Colwellia marinimaniae]
MYRNFFSLSELPFSISPDPKYLFMSDRHREALAHLTYGLGEVGGFALLTGEVGTGKTTISRCLMEQLPQNTQAAFILNPTLSCQELLATICDEFKIRYRKTDASLKSLTDKIAEKLLKNHQNDINTLLIIDEAQHLQPQVLEQLRLLTNLETNTKKLLQVILIGQPELQQLLQRRDLRQLAQRITARYHLMPLTKPELDQYIVHRLTVADCARALFDKGALNKIHQLSQGVPRLINLLCHSALMLAYNQNDSVVNKKTVVAAAEQALGDDLSAMPGQKNYNGVLLFSTAVSVAAFFALAGFWWGQTQQPLHQVMVSTAQERVTSSPVQLNSTERANVVAEHSKKQVVMPTAKKVAHTSADLPYASLKNSANNPASNTDVITAKKSNKVADKSKTVKVAAIEQPITEVITDKDNTDKILVVSGEKTSVNNKYQDYQVREVAGVSSDLLARFQAALDETNDEIKAEPSANNKSVRGSLAKRNAFELADNNDNSRSAVRSLAQMPKSLKNSLPSMTFEQHIYVSDGNGWVKVNGQDRYEGDYIGDNVVVEKILPQQVILSFQGETFSLPALTNW